MLEKLYYNMAFASYLFPCCFFFAISLSVFCLVWLVSFHTIFIVLFEAKKIPLPVCCCYCCCCYCCCSLLLIKFSSIFHGFFPRSAWEKCAIKSQCSKMLLFFYSFEQMAHCSSRLLFDSNRVYSVLKGVKLGLNDDCRDSASGERWVYSFKSDSTM